MANRAYQRGRALEWKVASLFKDTGKFCTVRASGSHGKADVVLFREGDAFELSRPITLDEIDEVMAGWMEVHDPKKILDPFMFARRRLKGRNLSGEQVVHLVPATCWLLQMKDVMVKPGKKKKSTKG